MAMEIVKVRELLAKVALDHTPSQPDDAIKSIAIALLHMAEGIEELRQRSPSSREYF